jgi:primosomal protein N' (replication factor Y)
MMSLRKKAKHRPPLGYCASARAEELENGAKRGKLTGAQIHASFRRAIGFLTALTFESELRTRADRPLHPARADYAIPESFAEKIGIGSRVRVPFRDKAALATVVAVLEESAASGIRPIEALVGDKPALSAKLLELARWMAAYYCCSIETVMRSLLPQVIRKAEVGWKKQLFVRHGREVSADELEKLRKRAPRQAELLEAILQLQEPKAAADLLRETSLDNQTLRALEKRGFVELREEAVERDPHADEQFVPTTNLVLNSEQAAALAAVEEALKAPEKRSRSCSMA